MKEYLNSSKLIVLLSTALNTGKNLKLLCLHINI